MGKAVFYNCLLRFSAVCNVIGICECRGIEFSVSFRRRGHGTSCLTKHGTITRTLGTSHPLSDIFMTGKSHRNDVKTLVTRYHRQNVPVGRTSDHGLSTVTPGRRNVVTITTYGRCMAISRLFTITRRQNRPPFFVIYSRLTSPRGLKTVLHATRTANTRKIVIPHHHSIKLASAICGTSTKTIRCIPITQITGVASALGRLGGQNL